MQEILDCLEELRKLSGNEQVDYLNQHKSELLKDILLHTYDTHKMYKIDEGKYNKFPVNIQGKHELTQTRWIEFIRLLDLLSNIKSAKDAHINIIKEFIESTENSDFLKCVLFKDLRLNMNIKKFQKVWSDFLVEPQVQLAQTIDNRPEFKNPYYSRKFDGKRMYIKDYKPYSRTNKICSIAPVSHILKQVNGLEIAEKCVLDGECLYFEKGKENFQKGISLCQRDSRLHDCENICYVIFDIIPKELFLSKQPAEKFSEEYQIMLQELVVDNKETPCYSLLPTKFDNIYVARQDKCKDKLAELCMQNGWEGLMMRDGDSPYEYKRTNKLLKIKEMQDLEVKLIDMEEGTGKHNGKLGAFIADYKGYRLKIGSGFTDHQREVYWNEREKYIGNTVKVQYFEKTTNQNGEESLRFPVFICFRNTETMDEFLF